MGEFACHDYVGLDFYLGHTNRDDSRGFGLKKVSRLGQFGLHRGLEINIKITSAGQ